MGPPALSLLTPPILPLISPWTGVSGGNPVAYPQVLVKIFLNDWNTVAPFLPLICGAYVPSTPVDA